MAGHNRIKFQVPDGNPKCGAIKKHQDRDGVDPAELERCRRPAGWGTDHVGFGRCKYHGGSAPGGRKAAAEQEAVYKRAKYGDMAAIDPAQALVDELARANGAVQYLNGLLQELTATEAGDELLTPRGAAIRRLYQEEREALGRMARACIDIGLAERQIAAAERMSTVITQVLTRVLTQLDVPPAVRTAAIPLLAQELRSFSAGPARKLPDETREAYRNRKGLPHPPDSAAGRREQAEREAQAATEQEIAKAEAIETTATITLAPEKQRKKKRGQH